MDDLAVAAYGLSAVGHLLFAAYVAATGRLLGERTAAPWFFLLALLASAAWAGCSAAEVVYQPLWWPAGAALADLLRYAAWFVFLLMAAGLRHGDNRPLRLLAGALVAVVGVGLAWQLIRIALGVVDEPPSRLVLLSLLALPLGGTLLIEQLFRNLPEDLRWNAKPVCIGLACVFGFDLYLYSTGLMFGTMDADALAVRGAAHLLALPFLYVAARRRSDWIVRLGVSRQAAFHSATLLLAGAYLLLLSGVGYYVRYFGGHWGRALELAVVAAAIALGVAVALSGALRAKLRVFVGKHFFSYRYDYREEWLRFTARLSTRCAPSEVGEQVIRGLADLVECPAGSLWLRSEHDGGYVPAANWNLTIASVVEPADSAYSRFLRSKGWVLRLDEFRDTPRRYEGLELPAWLQTLHDPWLVVPLLAGDDLLGFVVLGRPRAAIDVDWEVLDLLKTASRQAAGHLAQMQATEALLEARKFEAFNRMSAFVVHDLKNIVTQLSLMLKNAERLHDNREFQQDMLLTVESSLEKMRRLMLQLRDGAAPPGGSSGVELAPIIARLEALAAGQGRTLEVMQGERLATRGHDDRLERVLGHLVQNALDATPADGRVWIVVERYSGQVRIEIGDTGAGMSEEFVKTRLFKPFNTTKRSGMGVGSYESHQYIRELGGSITVESEVGVGTLLTVLLPLFDRSIASDLMPLQDR